MKLHIEGMTCDHCQRAVKNALESVAGVEAAKVSLAEGSAEITGSPELAMLIAAVNEEGYQARAS